jgi:biotin carboxyl carrier protein
MAGVWVEVQGRRLKVELAADGAVFVNGAGYAVDLQELEAGVLSLLWTDDAGRTRSFRCVADEGVVIVDGERVEVAIYDPRSLRTGGAGAAASGPKALKAPMPGRVVRVLVADGEAVEAGQGCVVIEAMKMQNELKAPKTGVVRKLAAEAGGTVAACAVLLVVE